MNTTPIDTATAEAAGPDISPATRRIAQLGLVALATMVAICFVILLAGASDARQHKPISEPASNSR